jgi:chemotaxis protein histidine kinase CheA
LLLAATALGAAHLARNSSESDQQASDRLAEIVRIATLSIRGGSDVPAEKGPAKALRIAEVDALIETRVPQHSGLRDVPASRDPASQVSPPVRMAQAAPGGDAPVAPRFTQARPGDDATRRELAKSIQAELQRVGCYDGAIDGDWSTGSRRAMKAFVDRMNASLPVAEPDYILLTMLQGHRGQACGKACPPGQVVANDGACQPKGVVAQSDRRRGAGRVDAEQEARAASASAATARSSVAVGDAPPAAGGRSLETVPGDARSAGEIARQREQQALQERAARLEAQRAARAQQAEEQRRASEAAAAQARQAAADDRRAGQEAERVARMEAAEAARQKQQAAAEEKLAREKARREAAEIARARAEDERRLLAEAAAEERRRKQIASDTLRPQPPPSAEALPGTNVLSIAPVTGPAGSWAERLVAADPSTAASALPPVPLPPASQDGGSAGRSARATAEDGRNGVATERRSEAPRFVQRFTPPPYYVGRIQQAPRPVARPSPVFVGGGGGSTSAAFRGRVFVDINRSAP